jgi:hypothetical protein
MNRFRHVAAGVLIAVCGFCTGPTYAGGSAPTSSYPFNRTLSNNVPLVFGMDPASAAASLQVPLTYVSGRRGNEIYLAVRDIGGSGFFDRRDRLYLQFRHNRLTGWKGDWGRNWVWQ